MHFVKVSMVMSLLLCVSFLSATKPRDGLVITPSGEYIDTTTLLNNLDRLSRAIPRVTPRDNLAAMSYGDLVDFKNAIVNGSEALQRAADENRYLLIRDRIFGIRERRRIARKHAAQVEEAIVVYKRREKQRAKLEEYAIRVAEVERAAKMNYSYQLWYARR